jgi:alkanesulfonate monooxygenase SsuD/methylene tetrahydromethanopterin reductase-like flavin-dependent oxidoreductase (luciferase family)
MVPTFTRHRLTVVARALALEGPAPGRFDLGRGATYGKADDSQVDFDARRLPRFTEYLRIVQAALKTGTVHFKGERYRADVPCPDALGTTAPIAALDLPPSISPANWRPRP